MFVLTIIIFYTEFSKWVTSLPDYIKIILNITLILGSILIPIIIVESLILVESILGYKMINNKLKKSDSFQIESLINDFTKSFAKQKQIKSYSVWINKKQEEIKIGKIFTIDYTKDDIKREESIRILHDIFEAQ